MTIIKRRMVRICKGLLFALIGVFGSLPAQAQDWVFATAPTQTPEKTIQMYQPIVDLLSKATGHKIKLVPAKNFLEYTHGLRKDQYDIVFDGPHFVGWRMKNLKHKVVAKLPGQLRYSVIENDTSGVKEVKRLAGLKVCSLASPNLLTLGFLDQFGNPASQPIIVSVPSFKASLECVRSGQADAAIMRDKFWEKLPDDQKKGMHLLYTTDTAFPHRAFSVSERVDAKATEQILAALTSEEGATAGKAVLQSFKAKKFLPASAAEYEGLGRLLNPVWGFRKYK